ncbi:MAG: STAS domain-containing protein [Catenulispora sp.]|nr:STAS domain-containing protein [Catenulispora sp.]
MEFTCTARQAGSLVVFTLTGDVDLASHVRFQGDMDRGWPATPRDVVVDCSRVTFLDSMGLRVLVHAMQRSAQEGCAFALAAPSQPVRRVLELAGVTSLFSVVGPLPDTEPDPDLAR